MIRFYLKYDERIVEMERNFIWQKAAALKRAPYVSGALVIINILVFLICTFGGNILYNSGRLSPDTFFAGKEYYRVITAMFLHADIQHLVNNMLLLFGLGAMIEKEVGHLTFLLLYFGSGLGGQAASLLYKTQMGEWMVGSIGASGAVFGLVGLLLAVVFFPYIKLPNVTPARVIFVVFYSIYSGIQDKSIDNAAHIGGLLAGFAVGVVICLVKRKKINKQINI